MRINEGFGDYSDVDIKAIVEKYENLFKWDKYEKLFNEVLKSGKERKAVLTFLFNLGINPLEFMTSVSQYLFIQYIFPDSYQSLVIPNNITEIDAFAFEGCCINFVDMSQSKITVLPNGCFSNAGIDEVLLPKGLTSIGDECFNSCEGLTSIEFPSTLEYIGPDAFFDCCSLKKVDLSKTQVKKLLLRCFQDCEELETVLLPNTLTYIDEGAFLGSGISKIVIPEGVRSIGESAFEGCSNLTSIVLPASIRHIGYWDTSIICNETIKDVGVVKGSYADWWVNDMIADGHFLQDIQIHYI